MKELVYKTKEGESLTSNELILSIFNKYLNEADVKDTDLLVAQNIVEKALLEELDPMLNGAALFNPDILPALATLIFFALKYKRAEILNELEISQQEQSESNNQSTA